MTMVMQQLISKSQFKAQLLEYLRMVEKKKQPLIVTHEGKPVVKVIPYQDESVLQSLRNTVTYYHLPTEPIGVKNWEAIK
ncbi:type II toxin-antitoxin system Phd/YefM family antitoxin [Candidatus Microgenomates bacterium]|nr:type II toxin-antitoxin system Phd/YefM family antitoxin [Candidatus Microgenomates bacterium]